MQNRSGICIALRSGRSYLFTTRFHPSCVPRAVSIQKMAPNPYFVLIIQKGAGDSPILRLDCGLKCPPAVLFALLADRPPPAMVVAERSPSPRHGAQYGRVGKRPVSVELQRSQISQIIEMTCLIDPYSYHPNSKKASKAFLRPAPGSRARVIARSAAAWQSRRCDQRDYHAAGRRLATTRGVVQARWVCSTPAVGPLLTPEWVYAEIALSGQGRRRAIRVDRVQRAKSAGFRSLAPHVRCYGHRDPPTRILVDRTARQSSVANRGEGDSGV